MVHSLQDESCVNSRTTCKYPIAMPDAAREMQGETFPYAVKSTLNFICSLAMWNYYGW